MKHILAACAAAALLAACDTYPQGDPYSPYPYPPQGEPYPEPYPPGPYPPGPYPPGGYPPGAPYPPTQFEPGVCEGITSRGWRAWVAAGTDGRPTLFLSGTVVTPTADYRLEFRPNLEDEERGYPVEVTATLQPFPPTGPAAQVLTTHDLTWQWPLETGPVGSVTIECGDRLLAEVPVGSAR